MTVVIGHDEGGSIAAYLEKYAEIERSGADVRIFGWCGSACTMVLGLPDGRVCVYPNAVLAFHAGTTERGTQAMWQTYPNRIKEWITAHGGLQGKWLWLRGKELVELVGECK